MSETCWILLNFKNRKMDSCWDDKALRILTFLPPSVLQNLFPSVGSTITNRLRGDYCSSDFRQNSKGLTATKVFTEVEQEFWV